ncbi:MAG: SPOR domain-containing protein [Candidatus Eisenbacteria bacterium]
MNYFETAEEMAGKLGLELLHRANADSRAVIRHDRLAAYATDPVQSGYAWARVREEMRRQGAEVETLWLSCPYGGMDQLPWAVGFAEQLARGGDPVYIAGPEVPSLLPAHPGARSRELPRNLRRRLKDLLPKTPVAVTTDLEGVRIVAPHENPMPRPGEAETSKKPVLLWVQSLPEELGTRLPFPDTFDGVVFVASFRDHTPFELEACARQLRTAGQRLLGVIAIGPDGSDLGGSGVPPAEASDASVRPPSIWDDSLPAPIPGARGGAGDTRGATPRGAEHVPSNPRERGPFGFPTGRPQRDAESGSAGHAGMVTATSWAHLATGSRGTQAPSGSAPAGAAAPGAPPTPDPEAKRLLDRLTGKKSQTLVGDDGEGSGARSDVWPDPDDPVRITLVEADAGPSLAPVAPRGRTRLSITDASPDAAPAGTTAARSDAAAQPNAPARSGDVARSDAAGAKRDASARSGDGSGSRFAAAPAATPSPTRNATRSGEAGYLPKAGQAADGPSDPPATKPEREPSSSATGTEKAAWAAGLADAIEATKDDAPSGKSSGKKKRNRKRKRSGNQGGGGEARPGAQHRDASVANAETGHRAAPAASAEVGRREAPAASVDARRWDAPAASAETRHDGGGRAVPRASQGTAREADAAAPASPASPGAGERGESPRTTAAREGEMTEARTVPLIGLWEREHRRGTTPKRAARTAFWTVVIALAAGAAYWFGTGHTLAQLKQLFLGGGDSAASAIARPAPAANEAALAGTPGMDGSPGSRGDDAGTGGTDSGADAPDATFGSAAPPAGDPATPPAGGTAEPAESRTDDVSVHSGDSGPITTPPRSSWTDVGSASDYARGVPRNSGGAKESAYIPATDGARSTAGVEPPRPRPGDAFAASPNGIDPSGIVESSPTRPESDPSTGTADGGALAGIGETSQTRPDLPESSPAEPGSDVPTGLPEGDDSSIIGDPSPVADGTSASAGALTPRESPPDEASGWVVHLSSFRDLKDANVDIDRLRGKGIEARAVYVEVPERGPWYRVVAGSFASFVEARQRSIQLSRQLGLEAVHVISSGGRDAPVPIPIPKTGDGGRESGTGNGRSGTGSQDDSAPGEGSQPEVRDGDR